MPPSFDQLDLRITTGLGEDVQTKVIAYGKNPLTCPVRALEDWLELAGITAGPVFRPIDRHDNLGEANLTPHSIAKMVKDTARRAGLDAERFSGHSGTRCVQAL